MSSLEEVLETFSQYPSLSAKGSAFERLMVEYLRLDPTYSKTFEHVWLWQDWPGRDGKGDDGIDIVAQHRDTGELTAVQCKFYAPGAPLSKGNIDSFFTESGKRPFTHRMIITTTSNWSSTAQAVNDG